MADRCEHDGGSNGRFGICGQKRAAGSRELGSKWTKNVLYMLWRTRESFDSATSRQNVTTLMLPIFGCCDSSQQPMLLVVERFNVVGCWEILLYKESLGQFVVPYLQIFLCRTWPKTQKSKSKMLERKMQLGKVKYLDKMLLDGWCFKSSQSIRSIHFACLWLADPPCDKEVCKC